MDILAFLTLIISMLFIVSLYIIYELYIDNCSYHNLFSNLIKNQREAIDSAFEKFEKEISEELTETMREQLQPIKDKYDSMIEEMKHSNIILLKNGEKVSK